MNIFNNCNLSIAAFDRIPRYTFLNKAFKDQFMKTYGFEIRVGDSVLGTLPDNSRDKQDASENTRRAISGQSFHFEKEYGGIQRSFFRIHVCPVNEKGRIMGGMFLIENSEADVVERNQLYQLASLAHDLKNNLAPIQSYLEFITMDLETSTPSEFMDSVREYVEEMHSCVESTFQLVKDISDNIKGSAVSKGEKEITLAHVERIVRSCLQFQRKQIVERRITTMCYFDQTLNDHNGVVVGGENLFVSVLVNLISNAVKFNKDDGEIRIDVTLPTDQQPESPQFLEISVFDTGIGIDKDKIQDLCKPFTRLTSEKIKGTGIGLMSVKRSLDSVGGTIKITSEIHAWTKVEIKFPLQLGSAL